MSRIKMDVVDVFKKLRNDFPEVGFIVLNNKRKNNGGVEKSYYDFKLTSLRGVTFSDPIKTSISMEENTYIDETEYMKIQKKMRQSFYSEKAQVIV